MDGLSPSSLDWTFVALAPSSKPLSGAASARSSLAAGRASPSSLRKTPEPLMTAASGVSAELDSNATNRPSVEIAGASAG